MTIEDLYAELKAVEAMTLEELCDAYNLDDENDRQTLLYTLRREIDHEEARAHEEELMQEPEDIDVLCPRYSGQYAY